jgi:hypothetical protein
MAMRHVIGFILALAASAALFFGAGWGSARFSMVQSGPGLRTATAWTTPNNVIPVAALIGTALLIGILLAARPVSALATGLPGLALIGWSALVLLRGAHAPTYIPMSGSRFAAGFGAMLSSGVLLLLGTAMIVPMFMPSRWRSGVQEVEDEDLDEYTTAQAIGLAP